MRAVLSWIGLAILALVVVSAIGAGFQALNQDPFRDPAGAPPWTPNWAVAAPAGTDTAGDITIEAPVWRAQPIDLLAALNQAVLAEPRTVPLTPPEGAFGHGDVLTMTYRQLSETVGYPDHVNVRSVYVETGGEASASLVMMSRSVYGISDRGVNKARLERWLAALDAKFERVE